MTKTCSKCKINKSVSSFYKASSRRDGLYPSCKKCAKVWVKANKEHLLEYKRNYKQENEDKYIKYHAEYFQNNKERNQEYGKKYRSSESGKKYLKYKSAKHRSDKLNRTPAWANLLEIKEIYKNCPEGYHVDHIVPLKGKNVSGLHVEYNLQYLTATENIKKSNKFQ